MFKPDKIYYEENALKYRLGKRAIRKIHRRSTSHHRKPQQNRRTS